MGYESKNYEALFSGGYSSLSPTYGNFIGYRLNSGKIGSPTSIQTANQINEVVSRIREGVKNVEIQTIDPAVFEQIPKEHFKEIRALTKLTGVKASVHAPIIDPAGFGEQGYGGEQAREDAERRLFSVIEKSHEIDPQANVPVVIHSVGQTPGYQYAPDEKKKPGEEGRFREKTLILINQETKQMVPVEEEKRFRLTPTKGDKGFNKEGVIEPPREYVDSVNENEWMNRLSNIDFYKQRAEEKQNNAILYLADIKDQKINQEFLENFKNLPSEQVKAYQDLKDSEISLENIRMNLATSFDRAYKYGDDEQREELAKLAEEYQKKLKEIHKEGMKVITPHENLKLYDETTRKLFALTSGKAPELFKPVEEFAMEKAAETFGNVAFKSWEKFNKNGEKAPMLAIENMYQGMAFSRAEDMEKLIKKAREQFVENAKEKGMDSGEAKEQAKKLIGVTWDVGHLNMMRKHGFTEEDVVEETKKIAPLVKHIHITDNFGYSDSHLPPGMGNVPIKKIMEELEKKGALKDSRAVIEAGGFVQHFKTSPHPFVLSAFGSPLYGMKAAPYWNQAKGTQGGYFGFPLAYLPEQHFSMYGSGFSSLPEELRGQMPGTRSRFSGTEMA